MNNKGMVSTQLVNIIDKNEWSHVGGLEAADICWESGSQEPPKNSV